MTTAATPTNVRASIWLRTVVSYAGAGSLLTQRCSPRVADEACDEDDHRDAERGVNDEPH
jgi:hypothetical protein